MKLNSRFGALALILALAAPLAFTQQRTPPVPSQSIRRALADIDRKLLDMAKDMPEDRYNFKPKPEMRSFGEVLVHIVGGNIYAAKVVGGDKSAKWDEVDAKQYTTKAQVIALLEKSFADSEAAAKNESDEAFTHTVAPWVSVIEHSGEHYGLLVAYYRLNGMVPPETRKNPNG